MWGQCNVINLMQELFNKLQNLEKLSCVPMRKSDKYMCQIIEKLLSILSAGSTYHASEKEFYIRYLSDE